MSKPFSVSCPNCESRLKIQNPKAIGKKVRCPNCETPFTVQPPRPVAPPEDDFDMAEDYDDYGEEYDDDEDNFGPPRRSSRRGGPSRMEGRPARRSASARKGKPKGRKKKTNAKIPLIIGGAVLGLFLVIGMGVLVYALVGGSAVEMAWLPPDSEVIASIEMSDVWNADVVQRLLRKGNADTGDFNKALNLDPGESVDAIENITVGATKMPPGGIPAFGRGLGRNNADDFDIIIVVRKKTPWNRESLKENHEELTQGETTYYKSKSDDIASFFPDDHTRVMGPEDSIKDAITRGPDSNLKEKFSFMPTGHQIVVAFKPENPEQLTREIPRGMRGRAGKDYEQRLQDNMKKIQGGALAVDLSSSIDFEVTGHFPDSDIAGQIQDDFEEALADGRTEFAERRKKLNEESGNLPAAFRESMQERFEAAESVFNTVSARQSGENVVISAAIPASLINKFEDKFGGKAPSVPGFDPSKMFDFLGAASRSNEARDRVKAKNDLKQIAIAMHNYHDVHRSLPPAKGLATGLSWRVHILPYLGQKPLYDQFRLNEPWNSPNNMRLVNQMPDVFRRPGSKAGAGKTTYLGVTGPGGVMENGEGKHFREVTDGTSNTAMVVEVEDHAAVIWTQPNEFETNPNNPRGNLGGWNGGFHAVYCDGSVRFLAKNINSQALLDLLQRNDGHPPQF